MSVQPGFSIIEAVVGTRPAGVAPAASAPQDPFATLLAALVGSAPGHDQPLAAGLTLGRPQANPGRAEAVQAAAPGLELPAAPFAPDLPAVAVTSVGAERGQDLLAHAGTMGPAVDRSAGEIERSIDGFGPELAAARAGPVQAFDAGHASAAPPAGREPSLAGQPGSAPGLGTSMRSAGPQSGPEPIAAPPSPAPVGDAPATPAPPHTGEPSVWQQAGGQPGPAPGFGTTRPPDAPRAGRAPDAAPPRLMASAAIPGSAPQPEAGRLAEPGARPELMARGGAGGSFPDPASGPAAQLEPGEVALGRGERFSPTPASLPARPTSDGVAGQIGIQIIRAASRELRQVIVQLEPAELGRVHIRLEFAAHGGMKAAIAAERLETLELLQRDAPALERSLQDAGLRLDSGGVGFSLRRERGEHGRDQAGAPHPAAQSLDDASTARTGTAAPGHLALTVRLLDIHA